MTKDWGEQMSSLTFDSNIEIQDLLIVGDSDTSLHFSSNIQRIGNFTRVLHVMNSEHAIKLLFKESFPVIVIDQDAVQVDCITLSSVIRRYVPLSRIIVIAQKYSSDIIKQLINDGSVDAFLPIPVDDFTAYTMVLEQQAKNEINNMINNLVTKEPPIFSPSYYLLHDSTASTEDDQDVEFMGLVITYSSVTKFSKFYSDFFDIDEYLISSYITAISLLGSELFNENSYFEEINLAGTSIVLHVMDGVQFLFFFRYLDKSNYMAVEEHIKRLIQNVATNYSDELKRVMPLSKDANQSIERQLESLKTQHDDFLHTMHKQNIIIYGNQLPKLNTILSRKRNKYNIERFTKIDDLIDYLMNNEADVLIMNQVLDENEWNFSIASQAKDIHPGIQIVALLRRMKQIHLLKILNNDYIDFVLSYKDSEETIEKYLDKAFSEAINIKGKKKFLPHNIRYSFHQATIARSVLRTDKTAFEQSNIPELYGVFISQGDMPFYSNFWPHSDTNFNFDETLFAGFLASMEAFTDEIFDTHEQFSGFKFGDVHIVVKNIFEFSFAFFAGNLDHTNFTYVDKAFKRSAELMYDLISNSEVFDHNESLHTVSIVKLIYQVMIEQFMRFVSLNLL